MIKILATATSLGLLATASPATVVDAFDLNVTSAAGTNSTAVLAAGQIYRLTVSGRFFLGTNLRRHLADAEYFNLGFLPVAPINGTGIEIGVGVNGADIDFGPFNPASIYSAFITGAGSTINVFYSDSAYGDNSGALQIEIAAVPVPAAGMMLLAGLGGLSLLRRRKT